MVPAPTDVGQRIIRTIAQVGVPAITLLVVVLPEVIREIDENMGEHLPPAFRAWMLGLAVLLTAIAATITKVMALKSVNDWLSRWTPFGTEKRHVARSRE